MGQPHPDAKANTPDHQTHPRLRPIDATAVMHEGEQMVALRDPAGFAEPIAVSPALFLLAAHMDGDHGVEELQAAFLRRAGTVIPAEQVEHLIVTLDEHHYLAGPLFEDRRRQLTDDFRAAEYREIMHAGAYGGEELEACLEFLDQQFSRENGPGSPPRVRWSSDAADSQAGATEAPHRVQSNKPLRAWIAPHIDLHRGGSCYGWIYREVAEELPGDIDTCVIFGTCHAAQETLLTLTAKDYATPFGPLRTDRDLLEALLARWQGSADLLQDELCHRQEHSIEFQALYLRYIHEHRRRAAVAAGDGDNQPGREILALPVLCGSFQQLVLDGTPPSEHADLNHFVSALHGALNALGRRAVFVASADLAHIGSQFGDPGLTEEQLREVGKADKAMLQAVTSLDLDGFYRDIARDGDARRICGFPPISALLATLNGSSQGISAKPSDSLAGRLVRYDQWYDGESSVTYAGVSYHDA